MQGRMVDIEKLRASNENVKAVGNMNVNARGDVVGPGGAIIKSKEQQMKDYYNSPKGQVSDVRIKSSKQQPVPQKTVVPQMVQAQVLTPQTAAPKQGTTTNQFKPKNGIDAALDGIE